MDFLQQSNLENAARHFNLDDITRHNNLDNAAQQLNPDNALHHIANAAGEASESMRRLVMDVEGGIAAGIERHSSTSPTQTHLSFRRSGLIGELLSLVGNPSGLL